MRKLPRKVNSIQGITLGGLETNDLETWHFCRIPQPGVEAATSKRSVLCQPMGSAARYDRCLDNTLEMKTRLLRKLKQLLQPKQSY